MPRSHIDWLLSPFLLDRSPSDFSRIPLPVTLPDYSDFVFLATSVSVKKTVVSVTPGNSCRMTGRPIFVVGRIDFVTLRTRESIIIMDCELIHNCSHSLHQGSVEWHHPPSGSSSFIRVGIRQPGPKFSPGIENLFPCRPFFCWHDMRTLNSSPYGRTRTLMSSSINSSDRILFWG